ncbi:response regulator [Candidatus Viridilinea mediisalina]|uniref:Two-component system response regulator n=1 Tax=Candidatus Viridilinea mediisalina TaxID=2024553 RepID=A0A2A6RNZ1_9CHLR|nr:response regulator [Candidatus Viridilinea mediisalina]PDW04589.1 two-component system response regulator [Candidatus Viridilinea mediisalina]
MTYILLVEDDTMIRTMVEARLTRAGYEVVCASDGIEALMRVRERLPNLIVLDMGLPKLNGWQTTQRLRARRDSAEVPIIALTAYALDADRERALAAGCNAFEPKPIDFASLLGTIERLLRK